MLSTLIDNEFTVKQATMIVGGLSKPGKMPGSGWSIPAAECKRGSKLREKKGTACFGCYACKGRYSFANVQKALYNRLESFKNPLWIFAMAFLLKNESYFRWFDSGDLQSEEMLGKIVEVCNKTPKCNHWLPTREYAIVKKFLSKGNTIPDNLNVRISADMIGKLPSCKIMDAATFSTISLTETDPITKSAFNCPVSMKKEIKTCDEAGCRKCWDKNTQHINYKKH